MQARWAMASDTAEVLEAVRRFFGDSESQLGHGNEAGGPEQHIRG